MAQHSRIAQSWATNPANFPQWSANALPGESGFEFPKQLTKLCTEADIEQWRVKNVKYDAGAREHYFDHAPPRLGTLIPITTTAEMFDLGLCSEVGQPVIVRDADEERRIREMLGQPVDALPPPKIVRIPIAGDTITAHPAKPKRGKDR